MMESRRALQPTSILLSRNFCARARILTQVANDFFLCKTGGCNSRGVYLNCDCSQAKFPASFLDALSEKPSPSATREEFKGPTNLVRMQDSAAAAAHSP